MAPVGTTARVSLRTDSFDLAARTFLSLLVQRKEAKKAHPGDALSRRESPLRCSRARGNASTQHPVATKRGGHPCPPTPARAALLGASQGNPVSQKNSKAAAAVDYPLSRARERVARQRRVREHSSTERNLRGVFPHSPPSAGLSPARGREEQASQRDFERSAAKRSEPLDVFLIFTPWQRRLEWRATNGRGLRGLLSLLTLDARAKRSKARPARSTLSASRWPQAEPAP